MASTIGMQVRKKPKILLSSFSADERKELSDKIRSIGGIIYESSNYTSCASHIICKLPSRGEKFICACAEGKWILARSYVDESFAKRQWLDEEAFEWTLDKASSEPERNHLFSLPRKWRLRQESGKKRIFTGWIVVLIFSDQKKKEGFKRLIEAGGGRVLVLKSPYCNLVKKQVKYAIAEDRKAKDLKHFVRAGVPILPCERIPEFITKEFDVDTVLGKSSVIEDQASSLQKEEKTVLKTITDTNSLKTKKSPLQKSVRFTPKRQTVLKNFFVNLTEHYRSEKKTATGSPKSENPIINDFTDSKKECCLLKSTPQDLSVPIRKPSPLSEKKTSDKIDSPYYAKDAFQKCCLEKAPSPPTVSSVKKAANRCSVDKFEVSKKKYGRKIIDVINLEAAVNSKEEQNCSNTQLNSNSLHSPGSHLSGQDAESKLKRFLFNPERNSDNQSKINQTSNNSDAKQPLLYKNISNINSNISGSNDNDDLLVTHTSNVELGIKENVAQNDIVNAVTSDNSVKVVKKRKRTGTSRSSKKSNELIKNIILVGLQIEAPLTRNAKKKRSLDSLHIPNDNSNADIQIKKTKLDDGNHHHKNINYDLHLHSIFPWTIEKAEMDIVKHSLHRNGIDLVEVRIEDGHKNIAVKMMSDYLTPSCYLTPSLLFTLMQMLEDPDDGLNIENVIQISSLLNHYMYLHPPHQLRNVYLSALRKPVLGASGDIVETSDPFSFLVEIISDARELFEENHAYEKTSETIAKDQLRGKCKMALLKFIVGVFETDFLSFSERTGFNGEVRPLLMQVLWPKSDAIGGGVLFKDLLKIILEITVNSLTNINLAPLKSIMFSILQMAACCCELSDLYSLKTNYGPACTLLVSELFVHINSLIKATSQRNTVLRAIFAAISPCWLAARLSDHIIGLFDASLLNGEIRNSLSKPLSLDKVISCYFRLIPKFQDSEHVPTKRQSRKKPLAVIGDSASESSKLNTNVVKNCPRLNFKRNIRGETKLHIACIKNQPSVVKQLLCQGIDPNITDNAGWTALHEACNHGNKECVSELLKSKDLNIYATAMDGVTALIDAVANNHFEVVKLLLHSGGSKLVGMKTDLGKSAYEYATTAKMEKLLKNMDDVEMKNHFDSAVFNNDIYNCSSEEIEEYLLLLSVLLRYFVKSSHKIDNSIKDDTFKELQKHIKNLNNKISPNIIMLLGILKMYLS